MANAAPLLAWHADCDDRLVTWPLLAHSALPQAAPRAPSSPAPMPRILGRVARAMRPHMGDAWSTCSSRRTVEGCGVWGNGAECPRLVQTQCWCPRDVGWVVVVYVSNYISVQFSAARWAKAGARSAIDAHAGSRPMLPLLPYLLAPAHPPALTPRSP